jgi:hypothetical protein
MLEVLVATLLVGLLVVPLATALAGTVGEARNIRQRVGANPATPTASEASEGWEWGPQVIAASWRPGPLLQLRFTGAAGGTPEDAEVGLWADGWLIAEQAIPPSAPGEPAATSDTQLGPEVWTGLAGGELVVRVRMGGGVWGPPWHLAVPGSEGGTPALGVPLSVPSEGPAAVVHRPGNGTSSLSVSWSAIALDSPPFGLLFPVSAAVEGWGGATLDGRSQWWWMESGRSVDLYF